MEKWTDIGYLKSTMNQFSIVKIYNNFSCYIRIQILFKFPKTTNQETLEYIQGHKTKVQNFHNRRLFFWLADPQLLSDSQKGSIIPGQGSTHHQFSLSLWTENSSAFRHRPSCGAKYPGCPGVCLGILYIWLWSSYTCHITTTFEAIQV